MILASYGTIASSGAASTLNNNLYASYNAESNVNDSFGSNNGTAIGGLTYVTGINGDAFQFNGTNSYVSIPNSSNQWNFANDFSISLWVNYNTTAASAEVFVSNTKLGGSFNSGYALYTYDDKIRLDLGGQSYQNTFLVPFIPTINTWYHVVVTRKRSTETKIYINGTLQSGSYFYNNPTADQTYQTGQEMNLGAYYSTSLLLSNIKMDAVNFWSKELTSTEVTELYTAKQYPF